MEGKSNVLADYVSHRPIAKVVGLYDDAAFDLSRGDFANVIYG